MSQPAETGDKPEGVKQGIERSEMLCGQEDTKFGGVEC
jgi:hypothetical protein